MDATLDSKDTAPVPRLSVRQRLGAAADRAAAALGDRIAMALGDSKLAPWPAREAVVSFCFDDFPRSALENGARILEHYRARATYYATLHKLGEPGYFSATDLRTLLERGHELGSHTYGHLNAATTPLAAFLADVERNATIVERAAPGTVMSSFCYPLGAISARAARALGRRFDSARGAGGGLVEGDIDLNRVPANSIYSSRGNLDALRALIERNAERKAWLLFYTHEVNEQPGPFGCTPALLESVVRLAVESGARLCTVGDTVASILPAEQAHAGKPARVEPLCAAPRTDL